MEAEVVVIGSGPAGVASTKKFLEKGFSVTMIEAGGWPAPVRMAGSYVDFRLDRSDQLSQIAAEAVLGSDEVLRSVKLSVPWIADLVEKSVGALQVRLENFGGAPIAAVGGLSVAWGAGLQVFDEGDLREWPVDYNELIPEYQTISAWLGTALPELSENRLTSFFRDNHPGLHPTASALLSSCPSDDYFQMHPGWHAVLAHSSDTGAVCDLSGWCLYGCAADAIWSASKAVKQFQRNSRFMLLCDTRVDSLKKQSEVWELKCTRNLTIKAKYVVCAGGAIGSARLVLPLLGGANIPVRLLSTPVAAFALIVPARIGSPWERRFFGLGQLQFIQRYCGSEYAYGGLFCGEGIPARFLMPSISSNPRISRKILREIIPASLFGNLFFDGRYSAHVLRVADGGISLKGGSDGGLDNAISAASKRLRLSFLRRGAIMLPFRPLLANPGSDLHFAGTLPMTEGGDTRFKTNKWGVPCDLKNMIVVDASVFPTLPPKSHTLTIMANASRIASHWAEKWA
jgi:choline dehydrogenase-like flavoprotein